MFANAKSRYFVNVVGKPIDLLDTFRSKGELLTLDDISGRSGVPRSTAYRILTTLESKGWIIHNNGTKKYHLGIQFYHKAAIAEPDLVSVSRPFMQSLAKKFDETINLAQLTDGKVVCIHQVEGSHLFRFTNSLGRTVPIHATALGKAIAAFLDPSTLQSIWQVNGLQRFTPNTITDPHALSAELAKVRRNRYAVDIEEEFEGVRCVGVPILLEGYPIGAISISSLTKRSSPDKTSSRALLNAAQKISHSVSRFSDD